MNFSDLSVRLNLITSDFTRALNTARRQTQAFSSQLARLTRDGTADRLISGYVSLNSQLRSVGMSARDVARIIAGISISQTFYSITRSIQDATNAIWEFNESLDYAHVTYGALFGSSELSSDFIDTLKQFSIDTIFEYSDIEGMARKLSAYGIEYKNLMYIIEGLTNIGTISGDSAALERLAVAIGQINAKGTLKAEEMRQLANAYTPIYDILRDKLHLTEEQLKSVGDLGVSSADAINAIVEYANEAFGNTAEAAVYTITGLNNRIVDSMKVLGANILAPVTTFYKSLAKYLADGLANIQKIYSESGLGGVFEYLVPDERWRHRIRSFIASIKNAISTVVSLFMTLAPYIQQFFGGVIDALTVFISVINSALSVFTGAMQSIAGNTGALRVLTAALVTASAAWLLFKLQAMGAAIVSSLKVMIVGVAKAIVLLTTAIMKSPILVGLALLAAVLIGVSTNAKNTNNAISQLIDSFNSISIGGDTADDILQAEDAMDQGADASDKFWESMQGGAEDAEDAIEGAGNAAKKASKSLLSFDEVFRLNENDSGAASGGLGSLDGLEDITDAFSGLGSALIPDIPDLSDFAKNFVGTLYDELWSSIKTIASGGATGALIGGLVGFAIGGIATGNIKAAIAAARIGAGIGGVVGAAFAGFWTDTYKELEKSLQKIAVGGAGGALAGALAGFVIGAFLHRSVDTAIAAAHLGAKIGTLLGLGLGSFWALATEEMSNAIEGLLVGGSAGAFTGALVGLIIGAFIGQPGKRLQTALTGAKIGSAIGGAIGGALGAFWGNASDEMKNAMENALSGAKAASYGAFFGALLGMVVGAIVGAYVGGQVVPFAKAGAMIGAGIGGIFGLIGAEIKKQLEGSTLLGISSLSSSTSSVGGSFADLVKSLKNMAKSLADVFVPLIALLAEVSALIVPIIEAILPSLAEVFKVLAEAIGVLIEYVLIPSVMSDLNTILKVTAVVLKVLAGAIQYIVVPSIKLLGGAVEVMMFFIDFIKSVFTGAIKAFIAFLKGDYSTAKELLIAPFKKFKEGFESLELTKVVRKAADAVVEWLGGVAVSLSEWAVGAKEFVRNMWHKLFDADTWFDAWSLISGWFGKLLADILDWFLTTSIKVAKAWLSLFDADTWFDAWSLVSGWFGKLLTDVLGWFLDTVVKIAKAWMSLFNINNWIAAWDLVSGWFGKLLADVLGWFLATVTKVAKAWAALFNINNWIVAWDLVSGWFGKLITAIVNWFVDTKETIKNRWKELFNTAAWSAAWDLVKRWFIILVGEVVTWFNNTKETVKNNWKGLFNTDNWSSAWSLVKGWFSNLKTDIANWFTSIGKDIAKWWKNLWDFNMPDISLGNFSLGGLTGHATGGIFTKEHIARFAEGNKAEAVIPLENASAMQPFVNAISDGILQGLLPSLSVSGSNNGNSLPPMYVGTLIADERGLQQLYKKFEVYEAKELARKGLA